MDAISLRTGSPDRSTDDSVRLMRRVAICMFLIGGSTSASGVVITQSTPTARLTQAVCAVSFMVCGLVLTVLRANRTVIAGAVMVSIGILGVVMAGSDPIGMGPLFYLWPVVFTAYFYGRRMLAAAFTLMVVTLGIGLTVNAHHQLKADTFIGTVSSVGLMAGLVAVMNERESRLRAELARLADTDPLTGLLNRRAFNPALVLMVERSTTQQSGLSVVMFDIDNFKAYNDRNGHLAGDEALLHMARVLREQSRDGDAVSRQGGEEFAVALPGAGEDEARAYAERVARMLPRPGQADTLQFTTSAGISTLCDGLDRGDLLLAAADRALYAAKSGGRDRAVCWSPVLDRESAPGTATGPDHVHARRDRRLRTS